MKLEAHGRAVERAAVVAPKLQEAAAILFARHLAAAVLKAGVHGGAIGAEGQAGRLVVEVFRIVSLEDGVAPTRRVDGLKQNRDNVVNVEPRRRLQ